MHRVAEPWASAQHDLHSEVRYAASVFCLITPCDCCSCANWIDPEGVAPLYYEFGYLNSAGQAQILQPRTASQSTAAGLTLPRGNLTLYASVSDQNAAAARRMMLVTVSGAPLLVWCLRLLTRSACSSACGSCCVSRSERWRQRARAKREQPEFQLGAVARQPAEWRAELEPAVELAAAQPR